MTGVQTCALPIYLNENAIYGRIACRRVVIRRIANKIARTSYPNILDTRFISSEEKASQATSGNSEAVEHIWTTWTYIMTNVMGFAVYLGLLSGLNPVLAGVVIVTTAVGYFVNKRINEWGYRHREEEQAYLKKMGYIRKVDTQRAFAKDIRIFGLRQWLDDVWYSTLKLYRAFLIKREKIYIWTNIVDLLLALLRNGIAYAYLIYLTLTRGMSAAEFLLYFFVDLFQLLEV